MFSPTKGRRRNEQRINRIIVLKNSTYPSLLFQNTFLKAIFIANTTNFTFLEISRVNEALAHALRQTRLMLSRSFIFFFPLFIVDVDSFFVQMILLRSLFVASLAGYLRFSSKRVFMAASSSPGDYSSAFVTCPNKDVAKKIARFACTCCIISQTGIIIKNGLGGVSVFDSYLSNWATVTADSDFSYIPNDKN